LAPRDNRFTGRTKRIAFTCRPEFYEELRRLAFEKNCYQIEILEKALKIYKKNSVCQNESKDSSFVEYEKQRKKESQPNNNKSKFSQKTKPKPTKKPLNQF
jgi:hypothetical protein